MSKLSFLSILMGLALYPSLSAQTISVTEAQNRAQAFFGRSHRAKGANVQQADLQLAHTSIQKDETHFYVFNDLSQSGFVIVSGDECAPAEILGYSENGPFDYESAPAGMKWWLSRIDAEIHACIKQGAKPQPKTSTRSSSVPAMIKTKWGQRAPYNNAVPQGDEEEPQLAGCVPIAMSQIMNYYQWPRQGTGSHTHRYHPDLYSADFGSTTYDWEHIRDTYDENSTPEEIDAVSTLVYHAGVSVDAKYDSYATSASVLNVPCALNQYFGYDASVCYVDRDFYSDDDWFAMVYDQLKAGHPLFYKGDDHAFVCHGYDADNETFAINWGWYGLCDGYYRLFGEDALHAVDNEGESHGKYDWNQGMVINIMPDCGGEPIISLLAGNEISLSEGEQESTHLYVSANHPKTISVKGLNPYNYTFKDLTFKVGAIVEYWGTGAEFVFCSSDYVHTVPSGEIYLNYSNEGYYSIDIRIPAKELTYNGIYQVYPAYKLEGSDEWQKFELLQGNKYLLITVEDGKELTYEDVDFAISSRTIEEGSTMQITHNPFYNGDIYYYSSDDGVATVDENGLITAQYEGWVTIFAEAGGAYYFNSTTASFFIYVSPWEKKERAFAIEDTMLLVGQTTQISYEGPQMGNVSYKSSAPDVVQVDYNGKVTALALGEAVITVRGEEYSYYYYKSNAEFKVQVVKPEIQFTGYRMKNQGFFCDKGDYITAIYKNFSPDETFRRPVVSANFLSLSYAITNYLDGNVSPNKIAEHNFMIPSPAFERSDDCQHSVGFGVGYSCPQSPNCYFWVVAPLDITYTMTEAEWGTICLPYEAEIPEELTAYSVTGINGNQLKLTPEDHLEMNQPYLLKGPAGEYSFHGPNTLKYFDGPFANGWMWGNTQPSTTPVYAPAGSYVLQNHNGRVAFYQVESGYTHKIPQFGAYLERPDDWWETSILSQYYLPGSTDAIELLSAEPEHPAAVYNLHGQHIAPQHSGLQIRNGSVLFVK